MSRKIKFRAWDEATKGMFYQNDAYGYDFIFGKIGNGLYFDGILRMDLTENNLMQFTGLKDKNGVEIYEGDIFKNHQAEANTVIWWGSGWHYENYHAGALELYPDNETCEVIGNIYSNPELVDADKGGGK